MSTPVPGGSRVRRGDPRHATASGGRSTASTCRCPAATMSRTRWPRSPSRSSSGFPTRQSLPASSGSTGSSAASPRSARSDGAIVIDDYAHHPTEIRAVLVGGSRRRGGARDRGHAAAPLHPPAGADGRVPERLQRCRRGVRRRRSMRPARSRSRASTPMPWSKACAPTATAWCAPSPTSTSCAASCAISPPRATWSSAWARATSPNGPRALADGICEARASK